ncbi:hypothetical protein [Spirosoma litoris]
MVVYRSQRTQRASRLSLLYFTYSSVLTALGSTPEPRQANL